MHLKRVKVQLCKLLRRDFLIAGCKVRHLRKPVNKDINAIVTLGGDWQLCGIIKIDRIERLLSRFQRLKKRLRLVTTLAVTNSIEPYAADRDHIQRYGAARLPSTTATKRI
jgi:hypothetical protein